jgi:hypothetical protein
MRLQLSANRFVLALTRTGIGGHYGQVTMKDVCSRKTMNLSPGQTGREAPGDTAAPSTHAEPS